MSLDGFVRAAGAAMGMARESFGTGGVALAPPPALGPRPDHTGDGSGAAATAFSNESSVIDDHLAALSEHDAAGGAQLQQALTSAGVSRGRMDSVIAQAVADVQAMGMSTNTIEGQKALVTAIKRHLQDTKSTLDQGSSDASTQAASANVNAAGYQSVAHPAAGAPPAMPPMPQLPQMPMGGMGGGFPMGGGMPLAPLGALSNLLGGAGRQAEGSGGQGGTELAGMVHGDNVGGGAKGDQIVRNALTQLGVKYSFGGGGKNGPGPGDDGIGLDCSGLVQYAYHQAGIDIPRTTYAMTNWGVRVPPGQAQPGDILLCNRQGGAWQHVMLVMNDHQTVEAPDRGLHVRIGRWPSGSFEVRRAA